MNFQSLPQHRRSLYVTGLILLALALLDVVSHVLNFTDPATLALLNQDNLSRITMIIFVAITLISVLVQTFLATKAMTEAKNPSSASFHISLAKLSLFVNALLGIFSIVGSIQQPATADWSANLLFLADVGLMFVYIAEAKQVRVKA